MEKEKFYELIDRYQAGEATPGEQVLVETYYHHLTRGRTALEPGEEERLRTVVLDKILTQTKGRSIPMHRRGWVRYAAAAVFLFAIATTYFIVSRKDKQTTVAYKSDVAAPIINKATLTIGNGKRIILDNIGKGSLAAEGAVTANKTGDGQIVYNSKASAVEYHTLTNPKGSRPIQLTLADGTTAWLNAASSITFPTAFTGGTREITMTGEAYFEVAHNPAKPFIVKAGEQDIKVLGTHFNINAYRNEPVLTTTLLEGSVEVTSGGEHTIILPGQQAVTPNLGSGISVSTANTETAIAWMKGKFSFDNTDLKTAMRQLERWYDVDVKYEAHVPDSHFFGGTPMSENLSEVLKALQLSGCHFKIEDKKIIVYP